MEDFLGAIFGVIFEILGEFLLEILMEVLTGFLARGLRGVSSQLGGWSTQHVEFDRPSQVAISVLVGVIAGVISVAIHPAPFFHFGKVHGMSLVISPLLTGLAMACIGSILRRKDRKPVPWESFWGGFAFALGMAAIRFVGTR